MKVYQHLENKGIRLKKKEKEINEDTSKAFMSFRIANEWLITKKQTKVIIHIMVKFAFF